MRERCKILYICSIIAFFFSTAPVAGQPEKTARDAGADIKEGTTESQVGLSLEELGINFVSVPAGSFMMGTEDAGENNDTVRKVTLDAFEMSATEVTNEQYCAYLNAALKSGDILATDSFVLGTSGEYGGREYILLSGVFDQYNKCWIKYKNGEFSVIEEKNYWPVVYVTWYGAKTFVDYYGLDLPTEAEWEYVARGGMQYKYGTNKGIISTSSVNYNKFVGHPVDAGSYPENPFGFKNMSGNVWEWCRDWYDKKHHESRPEYNPEGAKSGYTRVIRGGSWSSLPANCRTTFVTSFEPYIRYHNIGFRVVRRSQITKKQQ